MLRLYLEAPFAACRTFTAGWYRPTATFLTPSAAYGLVLNLAGIDSRLRKEEAGHDGRTPATLTRDGLPRLRLALGLPVPDDEDERFPRVQTLYQQLHNYPVGASGSDRAESAHGNKYNITPVRREFLTGLRALLVLHGNDELEGRVRAGLRGELPGPRYGLPFVGDNQYLPDRLDEVDPAYERRLGDEKGLRRVRWYERITGPTGNARPRATRLTIRIDRADLSRTTSALYAPGEPQSLAADIPGDAWTLLGPPAAPEPPTERRGTP